MLPDLEQIKVRRRRLGLTQSQFAKEAGVSRSLIAKIEGGYANPSYNQAKRIFETMERLERAIPVRVLEQIHTKDVVYAEYDEPIRSAQRKMKGIFSQLPVMKGDRVVGSITERGINAKIFEKEPSEIGNLLVKDFLEEGFPQFSTKTPVSLIIPVLQLHQAVLTMTEGKVAGIITNTDVLKLIGQ